MSSARIITAMSNTEWDNEVAQLPIALQDIHLTARYHHLYEENGDGAARLFVFQRGSDRYLLPFLIRALPEHLSPKGYFDIESCYGYTGPVSSTESLDFIREAESTFLDYCRRQKVVSEFIRFHPLLFNQRFVSPDSGMQLLHLRDYVAVDLSINADSRFAQYTPQNRNKIRKAEKAGYNIQYDRSLEKYEEFVRIYLENMVQLKAARQYYFSPAYFSALRKLVATDGALLLAVNDSGVEGAAVFLGRGKYAHYFLSSVTPEGRQSGVGNLLLHEGLNWAADQGFSAMHLGGGISAATDDPLLVFKQNFSKQMLPFYIGKRILDQKVYDDVIESWELNLPEAKGKFGAILQRYRWSKSDLPATH